MAEDGKSESRPDAAPLPPIAGKAKDLEALRNAVVDAANVGAGLWFSYLFVLLYLVITVGSVTHRNLLFESPVKLPFLNVDLPLLGFFTLGPAIFLVVHAYVLLHFAMLADKVGAFHAELSAQIADDDIRTRLRRQLPSNIFVQFLAGPRELREGFTGLMLRLIAQVSLVVGPLALLVLFVIQFLPYHHEAISCWQRIAVVIDLALLWALWPSVERGETTSIGWNDFRRPGVIVALVATLVPLLMVFAIATFPGEWLHRNGRVLCLTALHRYLIAGDVDPVAGKPTSLWSNRLVLPNLEQPAASFSARGRHLEGAVLSSASLRKVDFTAANLQAAMLQDADLREANFGCAFAPKEVSQGERKCAQLQRASFDGAQMQGVNLFEANLEGASLQKAKLQGARLERANLSGATLESAELQAAAFDEAVMRGTSLKLAQLQGASLYAANLQAATLDIAGLQGADLELAGLQGAWLSAAELQGANLTMATLDGASFDGAILHGASMVNASLDAAKFDRTVPRVAGSFISQIQGARLDGASLKGTRFHQTILWRADLRAAKNLKKEDDPNAKDNYGLLVLAPITEPKYHTYECSEREVCDWNAEAFERLKRMIATKVPAGAYRAWALERIAILDPARTIEGEADIAVAWKAQADAPISVDQYEQYLKDTYADIGCLPDNTRTESNGMLRKLDSSFRASSRARAELAAAFLAPECDGMKNLTDAERKRVQALATPAPAAAPSAPKK